MLVTAQDMRNAFDPVVAEVVKLVKHQIKSIKGKAGDRGVTAVLLVGGFGESRYLQKCLEQAIQPIELLCPPNGYVYAIFFPHLGRIVGGTDTAVYTSWSAIVRGAVIKGIATNSQTPTWIVTSRKAREHYGIEIAEHFDANIHESGRQ